MKAFKKTWALLLVLPTVILLMSSCFIDVMDSGSDVSNTRHKVEESFKFVVAAEGHSKFRVDGVNGVIHVASVADLDSISITGTRRVGSESEQDAQDHFDELQVRLDDTTEQVEVRTIQPNDTHGREYTVNYTIRMPDNLQLEVENVNGSIDVAGVQNNVHITNINGNVDLAGIAGNAEVELVNGNITCEVTLPTATRVRLTNVNGNLVLAIPRAISAAFSANVTNGTIAANNLEFGNLSTTPRSLRGTLGSGSGDINLATVNGTITASGF